jgi:hypothetical protein
MHAGRGLALVAALSLAVSTAAAQSRRTGTLVGLAGGATLSDFQDPDSESRWGGTAGLFVGYASYRTVTMLEVNWIQKGGGDFRIDYIEVPLTFGAGARTSGGTGRARFYTGVSAAFKLACGDGAACDALNGTEWGIPVGLMVGRWSSAERFVALDARYTFALSDVVDIGTFHQTWQFRLMLGRRR